MPIRLGIVLLIGIAAVMGGERYGETKNAALELNGKAVDITQFVQPVFHSDTPHYMLVQFNRPLKPSERADIEKTSVRFLYYVPDYAYFVTGPGEALERLSRRQGIVGLASVPGEYKLGEAVRVRTERHIRTKSVTPNIARMETVKVLFYDDTPFEQARRILLDHGAALEPDRTGYDFRQTIDTVTLPETNLIELAEEDSVFLVCEPDTPERPCNINAQDTSNVDEIHPGGLSGYGLDGTEVAVGIWDSGTVLKTHEQIAGRAFQEDIENNAAHHSTHVAGTIAGSGTGNPDAQGMAPNVMLYCWTITNDLGEVDANAHRIAASNHSYASSAGWEYDLAEDRWHWYGQPDLDPLRSHLFASYGSRSQAWDQVVHDHNMNVVVAAGNNRGDGAPPPGTSYVLNDGPELSSNERMDDGWFEGGFETIVTNGIGKNVITVGAIDDRTGEPPLADDRSLASFSSWGPADDGRIKPDLVANGVKLLSLTNLSNSSYAAMSGTSTAAPVVTGTIACLVQRFRQLFSGTNPSAATMKGILIHTAREGGSAIGPDYRFGWGLMDARAAVDFMNDYDSSGNRLEIDSFRETAIDYPAVYFGQGPIKVTLIWTDPAATPVFGSNSGTRHLVNDLDLSIAGPERIYYPWTLDPENPAVAATQDQVNHRDNIEQVYISSPASGRYTIHIGGQVNLGPSQNYTLCISGLRMSDESPFVNILSPFAEGTKSGIETIRVYASYRQNVSRIVCKVDGNTIDDLTTPETDGDITLDPPERKALRQIEWDTRDASNGSHTLEIEVTGGDGTTRVVWQDVAVYNEEETAELPADGTAVAGKLTYAKPEQWYSIHVPESATYTIELQPLEEYAPPDTIVKLLSSDRTTELARDDDSGVGTLSKLTYYLERNRTYYAQVTLYSNTAGLFGARLTRAVPQEEPVITPVEVDASPVTGRIGDIGDVQWYSFETRYLGTHTILQPAPTEQPSVFVIVSLYNADDLKTPIASTLQDTADLEKILKPNQRYVLSFTNRVKATGYYSFQIIERIGEAPTELNANTPIVSRTFVGDNVTEFWFTAGLEQDEFLMCEIESDDFDSLGTFEVYFCLDIDETIPIMRFIYPFLENFIVNQKQLFRVVSRDGIGTFRINVNEFDIDEYIKVGRDIVNPDYVPGEPVHVRVNVSSDASIAYYYFEELIPAGWTISEDSISPPDFFIDRNDQDRIHLTVTRDIESEDLFTLSYDIVPSENADGTYTIEGSIFTTFDDFDGYISIPVAGDSELYERETTRIVDWAVY